MNLQRTGPGPFIRTIAKNQNRRGLPDEFMDTGGSIRYARYSLAHIEELLDEGPLDEAAKLAGKLAGVDARRSPFPGKGYNADHRTRSAGTRIPLDADAKSIHGQAG